MARGAGLSLPRIAEAAPCPGSTVPRSNPQSKVTSSNAVSSHLFRCASPLNSRRLILISVNLPCVLHNLFLCRRPQRAICLDALARGTWLSGSPIVLDCTAVYRRAYGLRGLPLKPRGSRPGSLSGDSRKTDHRVLPLCRDLLRHRRGSDFNPTRQRRSGHRGCDFEHAVLIVGGHFVGIHAFGQREGALKGSVEDLLMEEINVL